MEGSDVGAVSETLNWEKNVSAVIDRGEEDAAMNEEDESLADFDSGARMIASGFNRSDCADQTVGEQARQLSTVSGQYEHDKKFWAAAVVNLEGKLKKMKDEHAQLSLEAHECADSVPELSQMSSAIQGLVAKCEDLKLKYEELTKRRQLDWAQPLLLLCIGWMVASVVMPKEIRSKSPIIYDIITLLVALSFCNILVGFFISDRFLAAARAVKVVGILSGLTAFFFATCIHLTPPLIITVFILYFLSVIAVVTSRLL